MVRRLFLGLVVVVVIGWASPAGARPPSACVRALQEAESIRSEYQNYAEATREYMNTPPATGTVQQQIDAQTVALRGYTSKISVIADMLAKLNANYEKAAKACRRS